MNDLGLRLKKIRQARGFTQRSLAKRINKSVSAISSYESNMQMPPLDVLMSLAAVFDVSLDYLVGYSNDPSYSTKSLTGRQKEVLSLLYAEFSNPTEVIDTLSPNQVDIIQKLVRVFTEH